MKKRIQFTHLLLVTILLGFSSCNSGPQPIKVGLDACHFCKMTIADAQFGAEIVTNKGKAYKFDDTYCVAEFIKEKTIAPTDIKETWLVNFEKPHNFILAEKAFLIESPELKSPMGGNIAAFETDGRRNEISKNLKEPVKAISWSEVVKEN